jgi:tetratricopeptide (TPR) repeat protein
VNQAHGGQCPAAESRALASAAVSRALAIDPEYPFAHAARAWLAMVFERDFRLAALHFQRALQLLPNNGVILANSAVLAVKLGRTEDAFRLTRRSIEVNPISSGTYGNLADQLTRAGRLEEAQAAAETAVELSPGSSYSLANLAGVLILRGEPERAVMVAEPMDNEQAKLTYFSMAYWDMGDREASDRALLRLQDLYASEAGYLIAIVHAWRGETDDALAWLNRALDEEQPLASVKTEPYLRSLHGDPRWETLLERAGVSDSQVSAIEFNVPDAG